MDGAWKIKAQFVGVKDFAEGLAAVLTGTPGKEVLHFIDAAGQLVIESTHYRSCERGFSEGLACVYRVDKKRKDIVAGYINRAGEEVIPCEWALAEPFADGLAAVMDARARLWGFVNRNGKIVIPPKYGHVESFVGGFAKVRTSKRIGPEFYINTQGDVVWEAGDKPRA
ncbi:MAG: WG repeat-containing protein [Opitutaceae bacterium]|nr:WG repeat-containing protein [Opitutaceae bacterium]